MDSNDLEKLIRFLHFYRDVYGDTLTLDSERIRQLAAEWPDLQTVRSTAPPEAPSPKPQPKPYRKETARPMTAKPELGFPADSPLGKFYQEIKDCTKCSLGHTRTHFVFGVGNPNADLMFIGEAPGRDEDLQGIPFVGRAGQLLNKLLAHVHLKREDVFIANILKCRPPNNRDPLPEEVAACIPYLYKQIEMIQPKVMVALGRVAAQNLLRTKAPLSQMRERVWEYRGTPMVVTYHPAAVLRNMRLLDTAIQDFKFIVSIMEKERTKEREVEE